ncbi:Uncharacterised protein [Yersinia rohdei]|nr:Uncharacterised protein [Yersinia rohdei]
MTFVCTELIQPTAGKRQRNTVKLDSEIFTGMVATTRRRNNTGVGPIVNRRPTATNSFRRKTGGILVGGVFFDLRPPTGTPQIAFVGTVAPLTAGCRPFDQALCIPPTILVQGDTRKVNLTLRTHFAPEVFQRAHLWG